MKRVTRTLVVAFTLVAQAAWTQPLPKATPESVGVSTVSQRDAALEGKGLPWMMLPGTPGAHIMIPINATPLSSGSSK